MAERLVSIALLLCVLGALAQCVRPAHAAERAPVRWVLIVTGAAELRLEFKHQHRCEHFANILSTVHPELMTRCAPVGGSVAVGSG